MARTPLPRNRLEAAARAAIPARFGYETEQLTYQLPPSVYTPDFFDPSTNTIIEIKGLWRDADRRKMKLVRQQYPSLRIIMMFQNPQQKISRRSKTTYRQFAQKLGIEVLDLDELKSV